MLLRNLEGWSDLEALKDLLFFAQRMDELTFDYTLDSYKAPTTNCVSLIRETIDAIDRFSTTEKGKDSVTHILDEAEHRLRGNSIVKGVLDIDLDDFLNVNRDDLQAMRAALSVLRGEIDQKVYIAEIFRQIRSAIEEKQRGNIDYIAKELCTVLLNAGVSSNYLNMTVKQRFFSGQRVESIAYLDKFLQAIVPWWHDFRVCFRVTTDAAVVDETTFARFKLELTREFPFDLNKIEGNESFARLTDDEFFIVAEVGAHEIFSAAFQAREQVSRLHSFFGLKYHKVDFRLSEEAVVEQACCAHEVHFVSTVFNSMHFVPDSKKYAASRKLELMLEDLHLPRGPDSERFFRIVDVHGLSAKSGVPENQLLNIWTCLETLAPTSGAKSTINSVVTGSLPFIGLAYFYRIVRTATLDLSRWNKPRTIQALRACPIICKDDLVHQVLSLLVVQDNTDQLESLFRDLGSFELLRHRLFALRKLFTSPVAMQAKLKQHLTNVEWQLHRIYRSRNAIVHSAGKLSFTPSLVSNAHDYFDQVFSLTMDFCSGDKGFNNFEDAFNFARMRFRHYERDLKSIETVNLDAVPRILWRQRNLPESPWLRGADL